MYLSTCLLYLSFFLSKRLSFFGPSSLDYLIYCVSFPLVHAGNSSVFALASLSNFSRI